tara:strand:- start:6539 stop:7285 length:747 start_codon:yes stop_codon:yes gene_type:complete
MLDSILPMSIFILLTILYLIVVYINGESIVASVIYYCILLISQLFFTFLASKKLCGTAQISSVFVWGLVPWVFIFFSMNILLLLFPGWKSPFSNTFGYGIVHLLGVSDILNNLLKSKFTSKDSGLNKIAEKIYEDKSILINEFTPLNFETSIQKLKPLLDTSNKDYKSNLDAFKKMVRLKDEISRGIWYLLTGILTLSVSNMGLVSSSCNKSSEQIKEEVSKYHEKTIQEQREEQEQKSKQTIYKVRD